MSDYCEDCGCRRHGGICSNCQEELYILTNQRADMERPVSEEFLDAADRQAEYLAAAQAGREGQ
jgi:hypothetical protein